jgi:hypothetical protein
MLRYQTLKSVSRLGNTRHRSSAALAENFQQDTIEEEAWGTEYGAGPSRLPYQPRRMANRDIEPDVEARYFAPASSISSTTRLRRNLSALQHGDYTFDTFTRKALTATINDKNVKKRHRPSPQPLSTYSRLELHTVIHHLLRSRQPILAAAVISHVATVGIASRPRRRRIFASRSFYSTRSSRNLLHEKVGLDRDGNDSLKSRQISHRISFLYRPPAIP